jgi:hypothetical protein
MWIVTIRADNLALPNRVVRVLQGQRTLFGMATETDIRLCRFNQDWIFGDMNRVATNAGEIVDLMLAPYPRSVIGILMATETNLVTHRDRRCIRTLEYDGRRRRLSRGKTRGVGLTRPMARFAFMLAEWGARIAFHSMRGLKNIRHRRLAVTLHAGGGAAFGKKRIRASAPMRRSRSRSRRGILRKCWICGAEIHGTEKNQKQ